MSNRWDNRTKEFHRELPVRQLMDNEHNWRIHPLAQQRGVVKILDTVGKAAPLLAYYSERQGGLTLYDGHLRKDISPDETWPVYISDIDDAEANFMIMTLDPVAGMAEIDFDILKNLVEMLGRRMRT